MTTTTDSRKDGADVATKMGQYIGTLIYDHLSGTFDPDETFNIYEWSKGYCEHCETVKSPVYGTMDSHEPKLCWEHEVQQGTLQYVEGQEGKYGLEA